MAFGLSVGKWMRSTWPRWKKESGGGDGTAKPWRMKGRVCGVWLEPGGTEEYGGGQLGQRAPGSDCQSLEGSRRQPAGRREPCRVLPRSMTASGVWRTVKTHGAHS